MLAPRKESYNKPRQRIKQQRHHFADKGPSSQGHGFSNSHVWVWKLDHKEGWALKNWCFQIVVLEKTLENPLGEEIKPVSPKGNQPWIFIGRTDAKSDAEADTNSFPIWLTGKDPDAGKYWGQEEKGEIKNEMVGWHHGQNGHEFEQTVRPSKRQGSLACCSPWVHKESDTT